MRHVILYVAKRKPQGGQNVALGGGQNVALGGSKRRIGGGQNVALGGQNVANHIVQLLVLRDCRLPKTR